MAISLNEVYVVQTTGSHLYQSREQILKGLTYTGPALFSVFSGASRQAGDLPPYLAAAAAIESRAFPVFTYDPSAGEDWASRFTLNANPQMELDWPVHTLAYEDEDSQRVSEDIAFTLVDFVALDRRYAKHLARVPRANWNGNMIPVSESLTPRPGDQEGQLERVPCVLMVDRNQTLQKVLVDEKLIREARRCREIWHSLQELGGIHNSHAERQLALERKARTEPEPREPDRVAPAPGTLPAAPGAAVRAEAPSPEVPQEPSSDEPYIETPRCTTCNECTQINGKMFVYNENRQAYIANPDAGTYAQLVEAAESCQVSIIHPGKPRNPSEPGLEELLKRAEVFR
jgi:ferredoxin